jgi:hypothetical protein
MRQKHRPKFSPSPHPVSDVALVNGIRIDDSNRQVAA